MVKKFITRNEIKDRRMGLSPELVSSLSGRIADRLFATKWYQEASTVCLYLSIKKEVDTMPVIQRAWADGKRVAAPRVDGKDMEFYFFSSLEELCEGAFHILEPCGGELCDTSAPGMLLLMPGVAFDEQCNRIGYGGGYYDRYLETHKISRTAALAYECQIVKELEAMEFDKKPEMIITEQREIYSSSCCV